MLKEIKKKAQKNALQFFANLIYHFLKNKIKLN
jgi:hypothetical protein